MAPTRSKTKPESSTTGLKVLITTASLVASLGGWAALTRASTQPTTNGASVSPDSAAVALNGPTPTARVLSQPPSSVPALDLPPLPTLVPPPARPTAPAAPALAAGSVVQASAPSNNSPAVQAQPTLRVVNLPPPPPPSHSSGSAPAPVTTTKSSGH